MTDLIDITKPDQDLIDDLVTTINRHSSRMNAGTIFGSLMVVLGATIHSKNTSRPPNRAAIQGMIQLAVHYLAKPPKIENQKTVIHMQ